MQSGISTYAFFQHRLHAGLLDALHAAGSGTIEVFAARHHFDYTDRTAVRDLAVWFRSNDVRAVLHQPIYLSDRAGAFSNTDQAQWSRHVAANLNLIAPEKAHRIAAMDEVKRALESAEQVPFKAAVLHLGLRGDAWSEPALEYSLTAIEHLKAFASPLGVRLLLENLENDITTPEHLLEIVRVGHFETVGVCLDVGHLHLARSNSDPVPDSGVGAAIALLGKRIGQVHLHDNHGAFGSQKDMKDEHLWPGDGTIQWPAVLEKLAALPASIPGILEIACDVTQTAEAVARKAETALRKLGELAEQGAERNM